MVAVLRGEAVGRLALSGQLLEHGVVVGRHGRRARNGGCWTVGVWIRGYKRERLFSVGFVGVLSFCCRSVMPPRLHHLRIWQDFNLVWKWVSEGDLGGHTAFFLAVYQVSALNSPSDPVVCRVLVELQFLGQRGEGDLSNTPSNTSPNSDDRFPYGRGDRGFNTL